MIHSNLWFSRGVVWQFVSSKRESLSMISALLVNVMFMVFQEDFFFFYLWKVKKSISSFQLYHYVYFL